MTPPSTRLRLAGSFTILAGHDSVSLVAGEEFRYTLAGPALQTWLPDWIATLDGTISLGEALDALPESRRSTAAEMVARLRGERVLIDATAADAHSPESYYVAAEGCAGWAGDFPAGASRPLSVLCQDRLDYNEAIHFNRRQLSANSPWIWASTGPMSRAFVGPLFRPDAGPCLVCLLGHFRRLSPAAELYDLFIAHAQAGRPIAPVPFPPHALEIVKNLLRWKVELATESVAPSALYRLHVLEVSTLEMSSHRVFIDPDCPECGPRR